jgi:hypothetical protein
MHVSGTTTTPELVTGTTHEKRQKNIKFNRKELAAGQFKPSGALFAFLMSQV